MNNLIMPKELYNKVVYMHDINALHIIFNSAHLLKIPIYIRLLRYIVTNKKTQKLYNNYIDTYFNEYLVKPKYIKYVEKIVESESDFIFLNINVKNEDFEILNNKFTLFMYDAKINNIIINKKELNKIKSFYQNDKFGIKIYLLQTKNNLIAVLENKDKTYFRIVKKLKLCSKLSIKITPTYINIFEKKSKIVVYDESNYISNLFELEIINNIKWC